MVGCMLYSGKKISGLRFKDRCGMIGPGECLYRLQRIKEVHYYKFSFAFMVISEDKSPAIAFD